MKLEGWRITSWIAAAMFACIVLIFVASGWNEDSVRSVVRGTAESSVCLFLMAFTASSLVRLWPGSATRWLRRNRRYVGVGFAASHFMHLGALVMLGLSFPEPFVRELDTLTLVGGGIAYLFITAMALTSSDRAQEWLGGSRWRWIHSLGSYYVWIVFLQSYFPRAWCDPVYVPISILLVAAIVLRGAASRRPLVDN